jgi:hypothetical protein
LQKNWLFLKEQFILDFHVNFADSAARYSNFICLTVLHCSEAGVAISFISHQNHFFTILSKKFISENT